MFGNRIAASACALFAAGCVVAVCFEDFFAPLCIICLGVLCGYFCAVRLLHRKCLYGRAIAYAAAPIIAFIWVSFYHSVFVLPLYRTDGQEINAVGSVIQTSEYALGGSVTVKVSDSDQIALKGKKLLLYVSEECEIPLRGEKIDFTAKIKIPKNTIRQNAKGVFLTGTDAVIKSRCPADGILDRARLAVSKNVDEMFSDFGKDVVGVVKAVTVKDGSVSPITYEAFRRSGTAHMLAVSGMHFTVIVMSVFGILGIFVNRKVRSGICIVLTVFYGLFIGLNPSVVRAGIMLLFVFAIGLLCREPDSMTSMFISLFFILLFNPFACASVGLWLSFCAAFGIIAAAPLVNDLFERKFDLKSKILKFFALPLIYSAAASIFTFPVTVFAFNSVSVIAPIANFFVGLLFNAFLVLCVLSVIFYPIISKAAVIFYYPCGILCKGIIGLTKGFAGLNISSLPVNAPYVKAAVISALLFIGFNVVFVKKFKYILSAVCCAAFFGFLLLSRYCVNDFIKTNSALTVNDTAQGRIVNVFTPDGKTAVIDSGGDGEYFDGIEEFYRDGIDTLLICKPDLKALRKTEKLLYYSPPDKVILPFKDFYKDESANEENEINPAEMITEKAKQAGCEVIDMNECFETELYFTDGDFSRIYTFSPEKFCILINRKNKSIAFTTENEFDYSVFSPDVIAYGSGRDEFDGQKAVVMLKEEDESFPYGETGKVYIIINDKKGIEVKIDERRYFEKEN